MRKSPTTRDIAAAAGVSPATVSYALRNHPKISESQRARIQEMAKRMGYRPGALLRGWMSQVRTGRRVKRDGTTLAFVTAWHPKDCDELVFRDPLYARGLHDRATELGFQVQTFYYGEPGMSALRLSKILVSRGIQAVVTGLFPDAATRLDLDWQNFSAATFGTSVVEPALHRSSIHHLQVIRTAIEKLAAAGRHRIGLALPAREDQRSNRLHSQTVLGESVRNGWPVVPPFLPDDDGWNVRSFMRWFRRERPEAVISQRADALAWMEQAGVTVPKRCAFVDLNWDPSPPDRAGMWLRPDRVATAAVDLAVAQMHRNDTGIPDIPRILLVPGEWKDGPTL